MACKLAHHCAPNYVHLLQLFYPNLNWFELLLKIFFKAVHILINGSVDVLCDLCGSLSCIDCVQKISFSVKTYNLSSVWVMFTHCLVKSFRSIVVSLNKRLASNIVNTFNVRRGILAMVTATTCWMNSTTYNSLFKNWLINIKLQNIFFDVIFISNGENE